VPDSLPHRATHHQDQPRRIGRPTDRGSACNWEGRGLARWRRLPRFQPPPVNPCMRFSRTRLTDIVHRQACVLCQVIVPESRWTPKRRYQA
jgi:hypothetical protein